VEVIIEEKWEAHWKREDGYEVVMEVDKIDPPEAHTLEEEYRRLRIY
jgi:hypothetical protein